MMKCKVSKKDRLNELMSYVDTLGITSTGSKLSVSMDAGYNCAVIGVTDINTKCGSIYLFMYINNTWLQDGSRTDAYYIPGENFGYSVAMSSNGTVIAVGAPSAETILGTVCGKVYILIRKDTGWCDKQVLTSNGSIITSNFGSSITVEGTGSRISITGKGVNNVNVDSIYIRDHEVWCEVPIELPVDCLL